MGHVMHVTLSSLNAQPAIIWLVLPVKLGILSTMVSAPSATASTLTVTNATQPTALYASTDTFSKTTPATHAAAD